MTGFIIQFVHVRDATQLGTKSKLSQIASKLI